MTRSPAEGRLPARSIRAAAPQRATRAAPARLLGRGDVRFGPENAPPPRLILSVPGNRPRKTLIERGLRTPSGQPAQLVGRADVPLDLPRAVVDVQLERAWEIERVQDPVSDLVYR